MVTVQQKSKPRGLGRGLSALISEPDAMASQHGKAAPKHTEIDAPDAVVEGLLNAPVESIVANRYQPRVHFDEEALKELAASIKASGVMQPIVVRSSSEFAGKFEIIAGERRFRASQMAGLREVPVLLRELSDIQALELAIVENIQRQDLNPLEEAQGYQRLMEEFAYTQEKLAKSVGKSRSHIANLMRLLVLPESIKQKINTGELSMGHARALIGADDPEALALEIINGGLSVRQAEKLVKSASQKGLEPSTPGANHTPRRKGARAVASADKDEDIVALEHMLRENLGLKVEINDLGAQQGQIVISYQTLAELDAILQRLDGN